MKTLMNIVCWFLFRQWMFLTAQIVFLKKELRTLEIMRQNEHKEIVRLAFLKFPENDKFRFRYSFLQETIYDGKIGKMIEETITMEHRISKLKKEREGFRIRIMKRQSWFKTPLCVEGEFLPT